MSGEPDTSDRIDRIARAIHAEAVERVPPHVLARLRPHSATPARHRWRPAPVLGWSLATACAAALVWAVGTQGLVTPAGLPDQPAPMLADAPAAVSAPVPWDDPLITFDEDPDLFVWLASEARPLAME